MLPYCLLLLTCLASFISFVLAQDPRIHLQLKRRGGRFGDHHSANLTLLNQLARAAEARYFQTRLHIAENRASRSWASNDVGTALDEDLMAGAGRMGSWYFDLPVGNPPQHLEVDVDVLVSDFYALITGSGVGTKYDTFNSSSLVRTGERPHPVCETIVDMLHFNHHSGVYDSRPSIRFPLCTAPKYSVFTRHNSGAILGLASQFSSKGQSLLSRIPIAPGLLSTLLDQKIINNKIASLTLLDSTSGVLTLGGTIAHEIETARIRSEAELDILGQQSTLSATELETKIAEIVNHHLLPFPTTAEDQFKWLPSNTAAKSTSGTFSGWWTPLMSGVWINGHKALRNQPVLLDLSCPFILAPRDAARKFYESIGGARKLTSSLMVTTGSGSGSNDSTGAGDADVDDRFWLIPCSNPASIAFEFAGWMFPALRSLTRDDAVHGPVGGPQSLGLWREGTGYCVGAVVESRMEGEQWVGSGMQASWVMGEPFFRGMGVAFDMERGRVGFRTY